MKRRSKKVKARGKAKQQPALPGLEPSPAWQRMKAAQTKGPKVYRQEEGPGHPSWRNAVVPGKCTCADRMLDGSGPINPWVLGHAYWCSMFLVKCEWCGMSSGTHKPDCQFWKLHPEITPF